MLKPLTYNIQDFIPSKGPVFRGTEIVSSGGTAVGITVDGGIAQIVSGAFISGSEAITASGAGATLVVSADITGPGGVNLGSAGKMQLEGGHLSGALTVAKGATVNALRGANVVAATAGHTVVNSSVINVESGATLTLTGAIRNSGTLVVSGGLLAIAEQLWAAPPKS